MTGLEKMKSQILEEAKAAAEAKITVAQSQAEEIVAAAQAEASKKSESISQKSQAEVANYKERVASSVDLKRRTTLLAAKQEIIAEVLEKSYASLTAMDSKEYFAMLIKLLGRYVLPEEGEIFFAAKDLERMPSEFEAEVKKIASEKGGSLTVSKEGRNIENGFILAYGGIEENCTLQAMFDAKRDELSDKVHRLLFV